VHPPLSGHNCAVSVVCIISFFVRGLSQSIDFTGGRNFVVQFEQVVQPETVRSLLQPWSRWATNFGAVVTQRILLYNKQGIYGDKKLENH
jgi:preprotein translocase subunit SecF